MVANHGMCCVRRLSVAICLMSVVAALQSCATESVDSVKITGTVVYVSLEGGFYGIKGDDGKNYDPTNLSKEFQINGLRVRCELKELQGMGSVHMWGTIVEVLSIQKL